MTKAEKTRQFIVERAAPIFNQKGSAGTSISDIMKATKLAKGGIYGNFRNKEEILLAVFDHIVGMVEKELRSLLAMETTARGKLVAILDFYREYPARPPMKGGCPVINFGVEADDTNPLVKKRVNEVILSYQQIIERLVQRGIRDGEFKQSCDGRIFAIKMYAMIEGGIMVSRIQGNTRQMGLIMDLLKEEIERFMC
jgi:TetR/AcrR family transcriptional regulator, transcriptional repressor for nem operon